LANTRKNDEVLGEFEILLEAARRATWDALHGPRHLRTGRFHPQAEVRSEAHADEGPGGAVEQAVAADGAPPHR